MERTLSHCAAGALFAALIALAAPALTAQELSVSPDEAITTAREERGGFRLDIGVGVKGGLNGSWMLEVPANRRLTPNSPETKSYYPAFGLGGDIGFVLEARAMGIVGLETGARTSWDHASGYNDIKDAASGDVLVRVNQEQRTRSWRIPLLVKLSTPSGVVRPTFGFGLEWAIQNSSEIEFDVQEKAGIDPSAEARSRRNRIEESSYVLGTLTFGLEIDMGPVKVPIELRAQYNLGYAGEDFDERVRVDTSDGAPIYFYDGAYQGHVGLNIGLIYDLELFL